MITIKNIGAAKEIYSQLEKWNFANNALTEYFKENKLNNSEKIILIKVLLIDGLYKTNLKNQISVAKHISSIELLDTLLEKGEISAVEKIAKWNSWNLMSFASKFCHFHNKISYPIYDGYVSMALKKLLGWKDNRNYNEFKQAINDFRKEIGIGEVSFEDVDKYLWLRGMLFRLEGGKRDINREIKEYYDSNKELFNKLKE
ncbi:unnamed protein product [marine sediment metagenome]|uniref:Uncharacterized protein n=1 Tax=marine sediment metagenome TaxID=412755 RepID=X0YVV6_9ZZZZ